MASDSGAAHLRDADLGVRIALEDYPAACGFGPCWLLILIKVTLFLFSFCLRRNISALFFEARFIDAIARKTEVPVQQRRCKSPQHGQA
ncbi:hypothetical protein pipiens_003897 [Culex pipiens pipiens]|uniref:Uncharacterized protein n=1 Tax=Culex pipiens pipiens TaxID=38569 RepID=A0ABD1CR09_CULPP